MATHGIAQGTLREKINERILHFCSSVCDPFKNRANRLLCVAKKLYEIEGADKLQSYIEKIKLPSEGEK